MELIRNLRAGRLAGGGTNNPELVTAAAAAVAGAALDAEDRAGLDYHELAAAENGRFAGHYKGVRIR